VFAVWGQLGQIKPDEFTSRAREVMSWIAAQPAEAIHPLMRQKFETAPTSIQEVAQRYGEEFAEVEAAWQAAETGAPVRLFDMRPVQNSPAHRTAQLAESVCSN
jgi:hypothetical protein